MTNPVTNFLAPALYFIVGGVLWSRLIRGETVTGHVKISVFLVAAGAIVLHALVLYRGMTLAITGAFSLVTWVIACLYLLVSLSRPLDNLGVIVMPLAGLTVLMEWLWPGRIMAVFTSPVQAAHIVISILAYSLLSLAAVQSLMLLMQERQLRSGRVIGFVRALPPMQTMETLMFQMIGIGFALLTLTLFSGVVFSETLFGQPLRFTHHVILSIVAWIVYAILIIGRWRLGWRGRKAINWTLAGFALLVLAYFGTKFVLEVLLHRSG